jgi:transformation/transcription domain-associated protein
MRMMEVFVLKFKTVSKLQLPVLMARHKSPLPPAASGVSGGTTPTQDADAVKTEDVKPMTGVSSASALTGAMSPLSELRDADEKKLKFGFPASQSANYSVADCRALVKTLVCGVKTITWGCTSCKTDAATNAAGQPVQVMPGASLTISSCSASYVETFDQKLSLRVFESKLFAFTL